MRIRLLAAVALAAAALTTGAGTASAACAGTARTVVVCASVNDEALPTVNPTGSSYEDCVYVGSKCYRVTVPIPTVEEGQGQVLNLSCGGDIGIYLLNCESPV
jgi:hypothetical protein